MNKKGVIVFGWVAISFAIFFFYFLMRFVVIPQEEITFSTTITQTTTFFGLIGKSAESKGELVTSSYVLLFWPVIFFIGGLFALTTGFGIKKVENLLASLVFILLGSLFFILKAPFPFNLICGFFVVIGFLFLSMALRDLRK